LPAENLTEASMAAIRYVRYSPGIRTLLVRSAAVIFFASSFWALLPAVAKELSKSALGYGFLLGFFGVGAVLGAVILQRVRARFSTEAILSVATAVFSAVLLSTATLHSLAILCILMLFGGSAWTVFMSIFNTMIQSLAPDWVRARVMASYLFVFQGSVTIGSTLWGFAAERASIRAAILVSAFGLAASVLLQFPLRLPNTSVDLSKWNHWATPKVFEEPNADLGPVLVTVKYVIDPANASNFLEEIYKYQRIRRRDGATRWGIYYDTEARNVYLETFIVDSWAEHERQHDRFTVADREVEDRVVGYALEAVVVKHYIHADRNEQS